MIFQTPEASTKLPADESTAEECKIDPCLPKCSEEKPSADCGGMSNIFVDYVDSVFGVH